MDPSKLEVPLGVALLPSANVEENLLGATAGIVGDDHDDDDGVSNPLCLQRTLQLQKPFTP